MTNNQSAHRAEFENGALLDYINAFRSAYGTEEEIIKQCDESGDKLWNWIQENWLPKDEVARSYIKKADVEKMIEEVIQDERFSGAPYALNKLKELLTTNKE